MSVLITSRTPKRRFNSAAIPAQAAPADIPAASSNGIETQPGHPHQETGRDRGGRACEQLTFRTDVQDARAERHGDSKANDDQRCRAQQRSGEEGIAAAHRAVPHRARSANDIVSSCGDDQHDAGKAINAAAGLAPAGERTMRPMILMRVPTIARATTSGSAAVAARPAKQTTMRSAIASTSSRSLE